MNHLVCTVELAAGEKLTLPAILVDNVGPGRWLVTVQPWTEATPTPAPRRHDAFLQGYAPADEGIYDNLGR